MSYSVLNTLRSSLSLLLGPHFFPNSLVKRFMRGVFRSRPPRPKYNITWNPSVVLQYLTLLGANEQLLLEVLGKKVQTFSKIEIDKIVQNGDEILIGIPGHIKTYSPNNEKPLLRLTIFLVCGHRSKRVP